MYMILESVDNAILYQQNKKHTLNVKLKHCWCFGLPHLQGLKSPHVIFKLLFSYDGAKPEKIKPFRSTSIDW